MYEHEDGSRIRRASAARTLAADEGDARALARQALQDSYDWRDDEPYERSAEAQRGRQGIARSISRTVGV